MLFVSALLILATTQLAPRNPRQFEPASDPLAGVAASHAAQRAEAPPLFIRNLGQFPTEALFVAQFPGMLVRVERGALLMQLYNGGNPRSGVLVRFEFEGASASHEVIGEDQREVVYSYFRGSDPDQWQRDVGTFGAVRFCGLYEGIDLVIREEGGAPKYDLFVAPGADLSRFVVQVQGVEGLCLASDGSLAFTTVIGELVQPRGRGCQRNISGQERWFECEYRTLDDSRFAFELPDVDSSRAFVIDPALVWSTYLGSTNNNGPGDYGWCVDITDGGDVAVAGNYSWSDFPMTPGAYHVVGTELWDIFVAKLESLQGALVYSAVIGGLQAEERPKAIKFDDAGRVTVAGWTTSEDFPTTPGAFDRVNNEIGGQYDAFVLRLNATGSDLEYSTFLGTTSAEFLYALALAPTGAAIVGGSSGGGGGGPYPTTVGAYQTQPQYLVGVRVGFITRLDPTGSYLEWSTLLGQAGEVHGLALDLEQRVTVMGNTGPPAYFPVTPGAVLQVPPGPYTAHNVFVSAGKTGEMSRMKVPHGEG